MTRISFCSSLLLFMIFTLPAWAETPRPPMGSRATYSYRFEQKDGTVQTGLYLVEHHVSFFQPESLTRKAFYLDQDGELLRVESAEVPQSVLKDLRRAIPTCSIPQGRPESIQLPIGHFDTCYTRTNDDAERENWFLKSSKKWIPGTLRRRRNTKFPVGLMVRQVERLDGFTGTAELIDYEMNRPLIPREVTKPELELEPVGLKAGEYVVTEGVHGCALTLTPRGFSVHYRENASCGDAEGEFALVPMPFPNAYFFIYGTPEDPLFMVVRVVKKNRITFKRFRVDPPGLSTSELHSLLTAPGENQMAAFHEILNRTFTEGTHMRRRVLPVKLQ